MKTQKQPANNKKDNVYKQNYNGVSVKVPTVGLYEYQRENVFSLRDGK